MQILNISFRNILKQHSLAMRKVSSDFTWTANTNVALQSRDTLNVSRSLTSLDIHHCKSTITNSARMYAFEFLSSNVNIYKICV